MFDDQTHIFEVLALPGNPVLTDCECSGLGLDLRGLRGRWPLGAMNMPHPP